MAFISTNKLFSCIEEFVKTYNLIKPNNTIIVGLSGGPDSVFLLYFLKSIEQSYNLKLIAAHLDHQWRPNSDKDVIFCQQLAKKLDIKFISTQANTITKDIEQSQPHVLKKASKSQEHLGRILRRTFFENLLKEYNAHSIALAHHFNDQEETFFIRLIRGASLSGLASIRPQCEAYIHPLLSISKHQIVEFLNQHTIPYLSDPTNMSSDYLRNKIRLDVIPTLYQADARFGKNFKKAVMHLQESDIFIEKIALETFNSITFIKDNTFWLNKKKFLEIDSYLRPRLIILFACHFKVTFTPSESFFAEFIRFLNNKNSPTHQLYPEWSLYKYKNAITIKVNKA